MTVYIEITDASLDPNQPVTSAKMKALRDNPLAIAEGDPTAPKYGIGIIAGRVRYDGVNGFTNYKMPNIDGYTFDVQFANASLLLVQLNSSSGSWNHEKLVISSQQNYNSDNDLIIQSELSTSTNGRVTFKQTQYGATTPQTNWDFGFSIMYDRADPDLPTP